jgi:putative endonuclease
MSGSDPPGSAGERCTFLFCEFSIMPDWYIYLIRTRYGALYTGIATDVMRRLAEHEGDGKKGARCLRSKGPLQLAYSAKIGSRALALKAESCIKKLPKDKKEAIVAGKPTGKALMRLLSL